MENNKARKSQIVYNGIELEVYQLPNGEYHLSKTQVGAAIEKRDASLLEWVNGKSPEALPFKGSTFHEIMIEGQIGAFHSVPLNMAAAYWTYWASKGNITAMALVSTSVVESLTRLCNTAFGIDNEEKAIAQMNESNMDTNKVLFQMMSMLDGLTTEMKSVKNQLIETNEKYDGLKSEKIRLEIENEELTEFKEDVEVYPEFIRFLEIAKSKVNITDYQHGITCKEYLTQNNIPLHPDAWCTLSRRTASFYRSMKGRDPERRANNNIYRSVDVAFIIATISLIMEGL